VYGKDFGAIFSHFILDLSYIVRSRHVQRRVKFNSATTAIEQTPPSVLSTTIATSL